MKIKPSYLSLFLILFLFIAGCQAEPTAAPTAMIESPLPTKIPATVGPTATLIPTPDPALNAILQEVQGGVGIELPLPPGSLLRFRLRKTDKLEFDPPISFAANDYDSKLVDVEDGRIIFRSIIEHFKETG